MRDPIENKDILPSIAWQRDPPEADRAIAMVYDHLLAARNRMRVLSFTHDAEERAQYPGFIAAGHGLVWEQYGDVHRGVCLLFDRPALERAIYDACPRERVIGAQTSITPERASPPLGP